ncbi:phage terminase large subunit [Wolbachia endosymbiont of Drosophila innubila]|uniref:phage terminase large subunit n=1 Tax=Wolbachia endosymbiont of Drosophila innubila TaxID=282263 RepID=UPI001F3BCB0E|nr:phage terminase large subunit [Wolbachia endosymbiont of Drosophila innubila]UID81121.1 phage terminase large subunit [Wolbachia endosymbiont of Drosophila innubila]
MNFLKFIELCFQTVVPGCEYNDYQYIKVIADRLEAANVGKMRRIIFNMPPRSMKSLCASVAWPAWILGNQPTARIIVASYSRLLSEKHSLDTRCIMQSSWYRELFPEVELSKDQNTKYKFQTVQRGYRIATSVGGTLTGEGGDFIIVDDPLSPAQALSETFRKRATNWFDQTLVARLNNRKKGVIVLVMHRLHQEDLTGHLLSKPKNIWNHTCLPMISENKEIIYSIKKPAPPFLVPVTRVTTNEYKSWITASSARMTPPVILYSREEGQLLYPLDGGKEEVEMIKVELGSYAFAAQYQQNPLPLSSGIIKREWLKRYRNFSDSLSYVTQSWDTAVSTSSMSNFSVCTTWTKVGNKFYLLDVYRAKLEYPKLKEQVLSLAARWTPHAILIEAKTSGQQLVQELKTNSDLPIIEIVPHDDKLTRFHQIVPIIESGKVFLPHQAVWLNDFEYEILMFPETRHDDQVDSTVQYLQWVRDSSSRVAALRAL